MTEDERNVLDELDEQKRQQDATNRQLDAILVELNRIKRRQERMSRLFKWLTGR